MYTAENIATPNEPIKSTILYLIINEKVLRSNCFVACNFNIGHSTRRGKYNVIFTFKMHQLIRLLTGPRSSDSR